MTRRRSILFGTKDSVTFDQYIADFSLVYSKVDMQRDVMDVLLNVIARASDISESVRRGQHTRVLINLSHTMVWILSLVAKLRATTEGRDRVFRLPSTITEAIWSKYPGLCPACLEMCASSVLPELHDENARFGPSEAEAAARTHMRKFTVLKNCSCLSVRRVEERHDVPATADETPENLRWHREQEKRTRLLREAFAKRRRRAYKFGGTLAEVGSMFWSIYEQNVRNQSVEAILGHLQEELGKMARALTAAYTYHSVYKPDPKEGQASLEDVLKDQAAEFADELADVISWMFSLMFKMRIMYQEVHEYASLLRNYGMGEFKPGAFTMGAVIWIKYGGRMYLQCADCDAYPCACPFTIYRTDERVDQLLTPVEA